MKRPRKRSPRKFEGQADDRRPHKIKGLSIAEFMLAKAPRPTRDEDCE